MQLFNRLLLSVRRFFEDGPVTPPEEAKANGLGHEAYFKGWHQNPYLKDDPRNKAWQKGYDTAKYYDESAW